jgi:pimeloyl-ACP methyl ester carboxylesterase
LLFAIFIGGFVIPTPFVRPPDPLTPGLREELLVSGSHWFATAPAHLTSILLLAFGFWLVYWRRRLAAARILMGATVVVTMLLLVLPMGLRQWDFAFAMQSALSPAPPDEAAHITLRNTQVCFPATSRADLTSDPQFGQWEDEEESLRDVGPDSVAFVTAIAPVGLPLDWRAKLNYVQADYFAGSSPLYSLRPARYLTDGAGGTSFRHAWMLPEIAVERLRGADAKLQLTYSLTLLKPREFSVPTDGIRRKVTGLGYCSAKVSESGNRIDIDCFIAGTRPAQITAELDEIPASRAYALPDFSPPLTHWPYGERVKLAIGSARLAEHDTVTVTSWDMGGQIQRSLTTRGILGADASSCPLPQADRGRSSVSQWRDAAPHEVLSIGVAEGVQLEVLDFGGVGPAILLLPGLGATAHSFDVFAPRLARNHRVIALTRRGTGASSRPDFGFDTPRLANDVLRVMDAMKLDKALLIGHSIAGDELTWLGGHQPDRFRGLVYLDAAYDRSQDRSHRSRLRELNAALPSEPPIPPAAFASYATLTALLEQRGHLRAPEGEMIAFYHMNNSSLAGVPAIDERTQQAIAAAIEPPDYAALKLPALAIFAIADPDKPLPSWYGPKSATVMATLQERARILDAKKRHDIEMFKKGAEHGEVLELANAEHNIILSNPAEVLEAIDKFDAKLQSAAR